jgi:hypothetical protein
MFSTYVAESNEGDSGVSAAHVQETMRQQWCWRERARLHWFSTYVAESNEGGSGVRVGIQEPKAPAVVWVLADKS